MALTRTQILPAVLALIVAAGTASAIYTPKTSTCPPEAQARKQQPGQPAPRARHHAPVSDMVFTAPRTATTFGQTNEAAQPDTNEVSVFSQTCPEGQCTIKIENGQVTALRDGQPVAGHLIQRDGEQIRLMGDDGREMMVVRVSPDGGAQVGDDASAPRVVRGAQMHRESSSRQNVIVRGVPIPGGARAGGRQPGVVVEGVPLRRAMRVAPQGAQNFQFHEVPGTPMTPAAPSGEWNTPSGQSYRFHAVPGAQTGEAHTFQWNGEGSNGQPNVIVRRRGGQGAHVVPGAPMAPHAPQLRTRVIAPHAPHAPGAPVPPGGGRAGSPRVNGQVIIQNGDGEPQVLELGELMQRHGGPGAQAGGQGGAHSFTFPGGQGQFRVQAVPGGGGAGGAHAGQGGTYTFRMDNSQGAGQAATGACCGDCKQDASCCGCGSGAATGGSHGMGAHGGAHSFSGAGSGTGQIVIDTGNGQPQVIELGDLAGNLSGHMGQLHEHLRQLQPHIQNRVQGHLQPHMDQLHEHLLQLKEIEGLDLGTLNLDTLGDDIELQIETALQGLDSGELELKIEAIVEDALSGLDMGNLDAQIQLHVEQALQAAGLSGNWKTEGGDAAYTLEVVPELLADGGWRVATGPEDHAPHAANAQPAAPSQSRSRVAPNVRVQTSQGSGGASTGATGAWVTQADASEQPKVMLGITMGEAPAELLEQIGLEPGSAIRIDSVIEGLPAAQAGLKPGSIIVAIDGESPATTTLLRERLLLLSPGDILHLKVVRGGQRQAIDVELVEYDAEALKVAMGGASEPGQTHTFNFQGLSEGGNQEELQQRIREAVTAMTEGGLTAIDQDALRQKIEAIVRDHMTVMGTQSHADTAPRRMLMAPGTHAGHDGEMVFVTPGQPMTPVPPGGAMFERRPDVDARLAGMEERLSKLEERLDRIAELLEQRRAPRD